MTKLDEVMLENLLLEMRSKVMTLNPKQNELEWRSLMKEYDMMFIGPNASQIYSGELLSYLVERHKLKDATKETLNQLIPIVCNKLKMKCDPMFKLVEIQSRIIDQYLVDLL